MHTIEATRWSNAYALILADFHTAMAHNSDLKALIQNYQRLISDQESEINDLKSEVRLLTDEIAALRLALKPN